MDNQPNTKRFERVRADHSRELIDDYVEMIADLKDANGEVRAVELAHQFGVSQASVNKTIKRLVEEGYATSKPYRAIFLTEKGKAHARASKHRHQVVLRWLLALGIDAQIAERDAEGIEHHISAPTLAAIEKFLNG